MAPVMFLVYVNYMTEGVNIYMSLFTDDVKILETNESKENCEHLHKDLDKIPRWSKLRVKKCKVLEMGSSRMTQRRRYSMGNERIKRNKYQNKFRSMNYR